MHAHIKLKKHKKHGYDDDTTTIFTVCYTVIYAFIVMFVVAIVAITHPPHLTIRFNLFTTVYLLPFSCGGFRQAKTGQCYCNIAVVVVVIVVSLYFRFSIAVVVVAIIQWK